MQGVRAIMPMLLLLVLLSLFLPNNSSPPPEPVTCANETFDCTVTNAYGSFPDSSICHAANVTYPSTEQELIAAVAAAAAAGRKVKAATRYSHSVPKLVCPGGRDGTIISTIRLNRTVRIDTEKRLLTVEAGMELVDLIQVAGKAGLSLPASPYWYGLTIGGLLATGAHGSSLWGKGGAVHEYVVGMRIVTPAPASQGFAMVRELDATNPDLDATKVSLGVLGVISQVTLALQPLFKRSVTFVTRNDSDLPAKVAVWGKLHEFGDIQWIPQEGKAIYREDDRVDLSTPGNGLNNLVTFQTLPTSEIVAQRAEAERVEKKGTDAERCEVQRQAIASSLKEGFGFTNDGVNFTGYPVIGLQHRIQASGECIHSPEDDLRSACPWDPRIRGLFYFNTGFSMPLSRAPAFVADVQRLRDLNPAAFCAIYSSAGIYMRYVRASSAYLGKEEDAVDFDIIFYRSRTPGTPRAYADVVDEIEQMALGKYAGVPHWGKSRNFAFDGAVAKYPNADKFLEVKDRYDPDGIFSSEWSDQVLGVKGSPSIVGKRCAIDGLCVCSEDSHCAPELGYFCQPGKVYTEARVCRKVEALNY